MGLGFFLPSPPAPVITFFYLASAGGGNGEEQYSKHSTKSCRLYNFMADCQACSVVVGLYLGSPSSLSSAMLGRLGAVGWGQEYEHFTRSYFTLNSICCCYIFLV